MIGALMSTRLTIKAANARIGEAPRHTKPAEIQQCDTF